MNVLKPVLSCDLPAFIIIIISIEYLHDSFWIFKNLIFFIISSHIINERDHVIATAKIKNLEVWCHYDALILKMPGWKRKANLDLFAWEVLVLDFINKQIEVLY